MDFSPAIFPSLINVHGSIHMVCLDYSKTLLIQLYTRSDACRNSLLKNIPTKFRFMHSLINRSLYPENPTLAVPILKQTLRFSHIPSPPITSAAKKKRTFHRVIAKLIRVHISFNIPYLLLNQPLRMI